MTHVCFVKEFHVNAILQKRRNESLGRFEWLVWWRGYRKSESTWEPEEHLVDNEKFAEFQNKTGMSDFCFVRIQKIEDGSINIFQFLFLMLRLMLLTSHVSFTAF